MPLDENDFKALRVLMREEIEPLRDEMNKRFREVTTVIDGLSGKVEKVEQEQLVMAAQLGRVESRLERVEIDVKVIRDVVERHDDDLEDLKKKRA
jgi:hypothetical protein